MARGDTLWGAINQGNFYAIDVSNPSSQKFLIMVLLLIILPTTLLIIVGFLMMEKHYLPLTK